MSKAILVIDMPSRCTECPLFVCKDIEGDYECKIKDYDGLPIYYKDGNVDRPDWCPLREAPERDLSFVRNNAYHYQRGWNNCVYQILGGKI